LQTTHLQENKKTRKQENKKTRQKNKTNMSIEWWYHPNSEDDSGDYSEEDSEDNGHYYTLQEQTCGGLESNDWGFIVILDDLSIQSPVSTQISIREKEERRTRQQKQKEEKERIDQQVKNRIDQQVKNRIERIERIERYTPDSHAIDILQEDEETLVVVTPHALDDPCNRMIYTGIVAGVSVLSACIAIL